MTPFSCLRFEWNHPDASLCPLVIMPAPLSFFPPALFFSLSGCLRPSPPVSLPGADHIRAARSRIFVRSSPSWTCGMNNQKVIFFTSRAACARASARSAAPFLLSQPRFRFTFSSICRGGFSLGDVGVRFSWALIPEALRRTGVRPPLFPLIVLYQPPKRPEPHGFSRGSEPPLILFLSDRALGELSSRAEVLARRQWTPSDGFLDFFAGIILSRPSQPLCVSRRLAPRRGRYPL